MSANPLPTPAVTGPATDGPPADPAAAAPIAALPRPAPWKAANPGAASAPPKANPWARLLPAIGPLVLFVVWDLVVRAGLIRPILLPPPLATLETLVVGLAGGPLLGDFAVTVWRTVQAFLIAAVVGMPLGVLLGSNERAYRSVEFLIDFFRSTPSSALIPLFLLIFGVSDINKVAIAAFGAFLIVVFNSAYGVINARKQRVMAARVMGATRWQIFKDVLVWESLQPSFVGLRSAVSMALVIVIVAEMFIGSDIGLGHRIIDAQQVLNVKTMYAAILAAGALGYALNILFLVVERKIVHWSGR
jgi:NitT/TauT family transport system permease protein